MAEMDPELRAELDRIEQFLLGPKGNMLADVLTALRGPDTNDNALKYAFTNHIRVTAFPMLAHRIKSMYPGLQMDRWVVDLNQYEFVPPTNDQLHNYNISYHYLDHIIKAAVAVGLMELIRD